MPVARLLILALISIMLAETAGASDCTDGVDCLCDCYANPSTSGPDVGGFANAACQAKNVPIRSDVRCFDFEAPPLYYAGTCTGDANRWCNVNTDCTGFGTCNLAARIGAGAPYYGPWSDPTGGGPCGLGFNSYWKRTHDDLGNGADWTSAGWDNGQPSSITNALVPCACNVGAAHCQGLGVRRADNLYNVLDKRAHVIVAHVNNPGAFDVDADGAGIPDTHGTNDNRGVWDGKQSIAWRIPASPTPDEAATSGGKGRIRFGGEIARLGITVMAAYSENYWSSGAGVNPNKHEEFGTFANGSQCNTLTSLHGFGGGGGGICIAGPNIGQRCNADMETVCGGSPNDYAGSICSFTHGLPFKTNWFTHNAGNRSTYPQCQSGTGYADCKATCAAATIIKGQCSCDNSGAYTIIPALSFNQPVDAPLGDWHCMKMDWDYNAGANTITFKRWLNTDAAPNLVELTLSANESTMRTFSEVLWNAYSNNNSPSFGPTGNTADSYRAQDNLVYRIGGPPVSCAEISGVGGGAPAPSFGVDSFNLTPTGCTQFQCQELVDLAAAASGTATGAATCQFDCNNSPTFSGGAQTAMSCTGSSCTWSAADACDYSALTAQTVTAEVRCTREGQTSARTQTFNITASAPSGPGGFILSEPSQDIRNRSLKTLLSCKIDRFLNGNLFSPSITRSASSPSGGGKWPTDNWLDGIDLVQYCEMIARGEASCTSSKGSSARVALGPTTLPPCVEDLPKPPSIDLVGFGG